MIDAFWWNNEKGFWDQQWMIKILDAPPFHPCLTSPSVDGGVLSLASDLHPQDFDEIQRVILNMRWVLLIISSREERKFPWQRLVHPRMNIWLQIPLASETASSKIRFFGHMPHSELINAPPVTEKTIGFFFAGQNTNDHRRRCVLELSRRQLDEGICLPTDGFAKGIPFDEYVKHMSAARIVPCPSGPSTASTFRCFEALECGALPIADRRCYRDPEDFNYWKHMLGYDPPFPVVSDWSEIHLILDRLSDLETWNREMAIAADWWKKYKYEMERNLIDDCTDLLLS